jgi:hypothetical protein
MVGIDVVNDELCTQRLGASLYRLSAILIDGCFEAQPALCGSGSSMSRWCALAEGMSLETFVMYVDAAVGLYAGRSMSWNAIDHLKFTLDSLCE